MVAALAPCTAKAWLHVSAEEFRGTWPEYCRAKYADGPRKNDFPESANYPKAKIEYWSNQLGKETWTTVHHYCGGLMYMQRAATEHSDKERERSLRAAETNFEHSLERVTPTSPLYQDMESALLRVRALLGPGQRRKGE